MLFSTLKNNNIEKCPFTYWLNGRWFLQIVDRDSWNLYPLYPLLVFPLLWFCISNLGVVWGGGGVMFLTVYAISNISRRKNSTRKNSGNTKKIYLFWEKQLFFYAGNIEKYPFTYWLNGRWFLQIVDIGNFNMRLEILKSVPSLTGLNGRWFLQIIDIHVGNFNMKLTGRWFPQIVDRDTGNLYI